MATGLVPAVVWAVQGEALWSHLLCLYWPWRSARCCQTWSRHSHPAGSQTDKKKNNNNDVIRPLKYLWFHNPVVLVSMNSLKSNWPLQQKQTWLHLSFPSSSVWNLKHWTVINKITSGVADWVFYTQPKQTDTLNYVNNSLSYRSSINLKIRRSRGPRRIFSFPSWSVGWCLELPSHRLLNLYSGKGFSQFQYYIWKELFSLISSDGRSYSTRPTCTANPFSFRLL